MKTGRVVQELKLLMAIHGGYFENYYSRDRVTHIICSNLPDAKVKQFQRERLALCTGLSAMSPEQASWTDS